MAEFIDNHYWWLDGNRLSQWARLENRQDVRAAVEFAADEDKRARQYPGLASGGGRIMLRDYDAPTMDILSSYTDQDELTFLETLNVAAGQKAWLYLVYLMSNAPGATGGTLLTRGMDFSISGKGVASLGINLYPHTTDITGTGNGSTITVGALAADETLLMMAHVEAVSGTGNLDFKTVHDPAGTPADAKVFTTVAHTDIASSSNHNSGQWGTYDGAQAATDYRVEITGVTGGTWNMQVAAAIVKKGS